jgi:cobalamin synthase
MSATRAVRHADLALLVLALPLFLVADLPLLGWVGTTLAWIAQKALQAVLERRAAAADEPKEMFRFIAGSLIGRSWLLALTIFAVGIVERPAGLAAAVLALAVFTTYLVASLITRPTTSHPEPTV